MRQSTFHLNVEKIFKEEAPPRPLS